jgi:hypothetical protein
MTAAFHLFTVSGVKEVTLCQECKTPFKPGDKVIFVVNNLVSKVYRADDTPYEITLDLVHNSCPGKVLS